MHSTQTTHFLYPSVFLSKAKQLFGNASRYPNWTQARLSTQTSFLCWCTHLPSRASPLCSSHVQSLPHEALPVGCTSNAVGQLPTGLELCQLMRITLNAVPTHLPFSKFLGPVLSIFRTFDPVHMKRRWSAVRQTQLGNHQQASNYANRRAQH
jgi:hypothetical protein